MKGCGFSVLILVFSVPVVFSFPEWCFQCLCAFYVTAGVFCSRQRGLILPAFWFYVPGEEFSVFISIEPQCPPKRATNQRAEPSNFHFCINQPSTKHKDEVSFPTSCMVYPTHSVTNRCPYLVRIASSRLLERGRRCRYNMFRCLY